ncbi:MAG: beta family protein [Rhodobacteraceae bacterium]|nr:beta family protein [Paracoccaceae bacterium]
MIPLTNDYVPTLAIRPCEMKGLEFLDDAAKNRMTPCFLLAPWVNTHALERAMDKIENVFPNRHYFLDLDPDYQPTNPEAPSQQEWAQLMEPDNDYANWVAFVKNYKHAWPVIQTQGQDRPQIRKQIEAMQATGRRYCMRITKNAFPDNIGDIIAAFAEDGAADYVIILEGGWTENPLGLASWFGGTITGVLTQIDAQVPIVVSCTSIPKDYMQYKGLEKVPFSNRELVQQVGRQSNRSPIIYGDWGSTRPREVRRGGRKPLERIDYPTSSTWYIARNKDEKWTFKKAAKKLVSSDVWNGKLGVWGERMIMDTDQGLETGIDTYQKNIASRVNIHLHQQAYYGSESAKFSTEDDWED